MEKKKKIQLHLIRQAATGCHLQCYQLHYVNKLPCYIYLTSVDLNYVHGCSFAVWMLVMLATLWRYAPISIFKGEKKKISPTSHLNMGATHTPPQTLSKISRIHTASRPNEPPTYNHPVLYINLQMTVKN